MPKLDDATIRAQRAAQKSQKLERELKAKGWPLGGSTTKVSVGEYLIFLEKFATIEVVSSTDRAKILAATQFRMRAGDYWVDWHASAEEIREYIINRGTME